MLSKPQGLLLQPCKRSDKKTGPNLLLIMYTNLDDDEARVKSRKCSYLAGAVFGIAWWLLISVMVNPDQGCQFRFLFALPAVFAVVSFLMINLISWESMDPQNADLYSNPNVPCINRTVLIFGTLVGVSAIGGAVGVMVNWYAEPKHISDKLPCDPLNGAKDGVLQLTSVVLIVISSWIMRLGNTPVQDSDW